jgi:predicted nucleic acid-binding Zn ribbon protein
MSRPVQKGANAPPPKGLVPAQKLVTALLAKLGYNEDVFAVFEVWDRLLGHQAKKARATGLKHGRLYIELDSNVHMHDVALRKRQLLKKLNEHFGKRQVVSDLVLELAKTPGARRKASAGS